MALNIDLKHLAHLCSVANSTSDDVSMRQKLIARTELRGMVDGGLIEQLIGRIGELDERLHIPPDDIDYPRDIYQSLIDGSPYAFYLLQWVPYQTDARRWRLKMHHDVKTFDGREAHGIWPNGGSCGPFKDEEVEFIRISRKQFGREYQDPRDRTGGQE